MAPCPEINVRIKSTTTRSLLDSGSMVTLMTQSHFEEHVKSAIPEPQPGGFNAHNLFNLKGVGGNQVPLCKYFTCDYEIGGMVVPDIGVLVKTDKQLATSKGVKTKLPVITGCNVFRHAVLKFIKDYGEAALELFECPKEIDPLFFSCIVLYYFSEKEKENSKVKDQDNVNRGEGEAHAASSRVEHDDDDINPEKHEARKEKGSKSNFPSKKKFKSPKKDLGGFAGRVKVGDRRNPICLPANTSKTIVGKVPKVDKKKTYMVESTDDSNLPLGVSINNTLVVPSRSGLVSVIIMNTNDHNVWIRQPLYAGNLWEVDPKEWSYEPVLTRKEDTNEIEINFIQVPPEDLREDIFSEAAEAAEERSSDDPSESDSSKESRPKFGPKPDWESSEFDFKAELGKLPFTINIGEAPLTVDQQKRFIQLIYENQTGLSTSSTNPYTTSVRGKEVFGSLAKSRHY